MTTTTPFIGKSGDQSEYAAVIRQNEQSVVSSLQIDATNNAMSVGPISVASGVTVTIADGGTWVIV
jgi:hypothetical protein